MRNLFGAPGTLGMNDMPSQGGISGMMPRAPTNPIMGGIGENPQPFTDMFGPPKNPFDVSFGVNPMETGTNLPGLEYDVNRRMSELYHPETAASERYNEMINNYPQMPKPGWLKVIGATLADLARPGTGMSVIEGPWRQQVDQWKEQIGPAGAAAQLERGTNINERTMAYQTISQELRQQADEERAKKNERDAEIREMRARIYEFKARNPNVKFDFSGPTVLYADPLTGEVKDTGVKTGHMSKFDIMELSQKQALGRIDATIAGQESLENLRQYGREGLQEAGAWEIFVDQETGKTLRINTATGDITDLYGSRLMKPGTEDVTGRGEMLPTQVRVDQFNRARAIKNTRPDLAEFIEFGPGANDFSIMSPGGYGGPTPGQHTEIAKLIYGSGEKVKPGESFNIFERPGQTPPAQPTQPAIPPGRVKVMSPTGQIGHIPASQLQAAIAKGYKQVQ